MYLIFYVDLKRLTARDHHVRFADKITIRVKVGPLPQVSYAIPYSLNSVQ